MSSFAACWGGLQARSAPGGHRPARWVPLHRLQQAPRVGAVSQQPCLQPAPCAQRRRQRAPPPPPAAAAAAAASSAAAPLLQEGWPLWTALCVCAALGQMVERRTPLGAVLSAPLVSMVCALAAAAAGVLPASSAAADAIWTYLMPLGAALYLLESDLTQ